MLKAIFAPWARVRALEQELREIQELSLTGLRANGSEINMHISGPHARIVMGSLVNFFHQNGGENFVTMELRFCDPWWQVKKRPARAFVLTVQRADGESPAAQLCRLKAAHAAELERLRAQLAAP